jgi:hypothetical protein
MIACKSNFKFEITYFVWRFSYKNTCLYAILFAYFFLSWPCELTKKIRHVNVWDEPKNWLNLS